MSLRLPFLAALLSMLLPVCAQAAVLYVNPTEGAHGLTDTFYAEVRLDNENQCVNAVHVELHYPTETLKAVDFSKGGSMLSLWIEDPKIDTANGVVTFSGGIPGGYCGRIQGDPILSNLLGKVVFQVVGAKEKSATISLDPLKSQVLLNDGQGTSAKLATQSAVFTIQPTALSNGNIWLSDVADDKTPPDPFTITVESTRGMFGGNYYAVFSTEDKQSGIDHYEIYERGSWKTVTSPHELKDQYLVGPIQIKAIDKAGNERLGTYVEGSAPARVPREENYPVVMLVVASLLFLGACMWIWERRRKRAAVPPEV